MGFVEDLNVFPQVIQRGTDGIKPCGGGQHIVFDCQITKRRSIVFIQLNGSFNPNKETIDNALSVTGMSYEELFAKPETEGEREECADA